MNIEIATKLADAVKIHSPYGYAEAVGSIVKGVTLDTEQQVARVMVDGVGVSDWITADGDTVRAADAIVRERLDALNF